MGKELQECIDKLNYFSELFVKHTPFNNIETYLKENFNCDYISKEYIDFMNFSDGMTIGDITLLSAKEKNSLTKTFEKFSKDEDVDLFCELLNVKSKKSNLLFIAITDSGDRYGIIKNKESEEVVGLLKDYPEAVVIYESFSSWLMEQINKAIGKYL